jgi:hypothetical protein
MPEPSRDDGQRFKLQHLRRLLADLRGHPRRIYLGPRTFWTVLALIALVVFLLWLVIGHPYGVAG